MSAGASTQAIAAAVSSMTDDNAKDLLANMSEESRDKLRAALQAGNDAAMVADARKIMIAKWPKLKDLIETAFPDAQKSSGEIDSIMKAVEEYAEIDRNGDGKISLPEAKTALEAKFPKLGKYVFKVFLETDNSGGSGDFYLDLKEWTTMHATMATFAAVDTNGDGSVSLPEAKKAIQAQFPEIKGGDMTALFLNADDDGDYYLSLSELSGLRRVVAAFAEADSSDDGKVSMPEAKKVFLREFSSREPMVNAFFMAADENKDFYLSAKEFGAMMRAAASFNKADKTGDGKISLPEAKKVLSRDFAAQQKKLTSLFLEFDGEAGDFYLQPKEYYGLVKKLCSM